jgi:hypothetical protein
VKSEVFIAPFSPQKQRQTVFLPFYFTSWTQRRFLSLKSKPFKIWLRRLLYEDIGKIPYNQALQDALMQLEGDAQFNGPCYEVFIRLASHNNSIYIDMANENWEQIEITPEGWQKVAGNKSPVKFKRTPGMLPIAYPDHK